MSVFHAASKQKAWDHFSKAQRKNLDVWRKQAEVGAFSFTTLLLLFTWKTLAHQHCLDLDLDHLDKTMTKGTSKLVSLG